MKLYRSSRGLHCIIMILIQSILRLLSEADRRIIPSGLIVLPLYEGERSRR